jgi:hypothetical protein
VPATGIPRAGDDLHADREQRKAGEARERRADQHSDAARVARGAPLLAHAHNVFASQWLQTGAIGLAAFVAFLAALAARYVRFVRSPDMTLAFVGVAGVALLAGFIAKNLTDDFLFRSNAKELWAMSAFLLGYGVRRERVLAAGDVPTLAGAGRRPGAGPDAASRTPRHPQAGSDTTLRAATDAAATHGPPGRA